MQDNEPASNADKTRATSEALTRYDRFAVYVRRAIGVLLALWLIAIVCMGLKPRVLVEPVVVPKSLADQGVTETVAQQRLTADLKQVIDDARTTMPAQIQDSIEADEPEANIELASTGISLQAITEYTKRMLDVHDVYIRAALVLATDGLYTLTATIEDSSTNSIDDSSHSLDPLEAISTGADMIMKTRNKFIYASALAGRVRNKCALNVDECNYRHAIKALKEVLTDDGSRRYYKWSWLALSKIDEDQTNYGDEVTKAMLSIKDDRTFYWGYYNWGIGLAEQGCGEEALEAFETTLQYQPLLDFAYNAAGRQALDLALDEDRVADRSSRAGHLNLAIGYLMTATAINSNYDEAYLNLGEAILELDDPKQRDEARSQYVAAILRESSQAKRVFAAMEERGLNLPRDPAIGPSLPEVEALDDVHVIDPKCGNDGLARSVRNAKGCLSTREEQILHSTGLKPLTRPVHHFASNPMRGYCHDMSVAKNTGELQPFLLNPVYRSLPVTGDGLVMSGP